MLYFQASNDFLNEIAENDLAEVDDIGARVCVLYQFPVFKYIN